MLNDVFVQTEDVAFGVLEPRGLFGAEHGDVIDCLEAWQVVIGEHDTARLERADRGDDVLDLEAQGRVRGLGAAGFREERDLGSAAAVYEFAARLGADGLEPELLAVEAAGAPPNDDREHATDLCGLQNAAAWCGCVQHAQPGLLRGRAGVVRCALPRAPARALPLEDTGRHHAPHQRFAPGLAVPANPALQRLLPLRRHRPRHGAAALRGPAFSGELRLQPQAPRFRRSRARRARRAAPAARRAVRPGAVAGAHALAARAARLARRPRGLERDRAGRRAARGARLRGDARAHRGLLAGLEGRR